MRWNAADRSYRLSVMAYVPILGAAMLGAVALLAGCSSSGASGSGAPSSEAKSCQGAGFELSLVHNAKGAPGPVQAAKAFSARGSVNGFSLPSGAAWHVVGPANGGLNVSSGDVTLHAVRLADKTWAIDSGKRC